MGAHLKKQKWKNMEMGNLLFGNSRGKYSVDRKKWQAVFMKFLDESGFDLYGFPENGGEYFENDTFIIRPYYWGCDEEQAELPNFVYKPTGFSISWYKYPLRDAYASDNITKKQFKKILDACRKSLSL